MQKSRIRDQEMTLNLIEAFKPGLIRLGLGLLLTLPGAAGAATIGGSLQQELSRLGPAEAAEVIVSFEGDGPISLEQIGMLAGLGLKGVHFQALPIAGVLATPAQVAAEINAQLDGPITVAYKGPVSAETGPFCWRW